MTLMNSLLTFAQQSAAPAAEGAAPAPAPAPAAPTSAAELEAAKQRGAEAAAEAAGQQEVSMMELLQHLNGVEMGVMVILGLCAIYAVALLFEKIYVMRKASSQTKEFLGAFRKANSVAEAGGNVR